MRFQTLPDWLAWQERLHPAEIELGLERLNAVLARMGRENPPFAVITVAGTNGKGSSVALLEASLRAAGYRVGTYTSPHLRRYNERVRIDGVEVSDSSLCEAFATVDHARGETSLTYFEFGTLAGFELFCRAGPDVVVLEVGMGGRLDAVNAWDPDVALVTALDLDHAAWLGNDRETIGREKAGIFRAGRPAVVSDPNPPASVIAHAENVDAPLFRLGHEFGFRDGEAHWDWWGPDAELEQLPLPALQGRFQLRNASGVLMVLHSLRARLPVAASDTALALQSVRLPGRFEVKAGTVTEIHDVAHNPQAAQALAANLENQAGTGRTLAVFAALADKDLDGIITPMKRVVDDWFVGGLAVGRGSGPETAAAALAHAGIAARSFATVPQALTAARAEAQAGDRLVVFGSFYTVAEAAANSV